MCSCAVVRTSRQSCSWKDLLLISLWDKFTLTWLTVASAIDFCSFFGFSSHVYCPKKFQLFFYLKIQGKAGSCVLVHHMSSTKLRNSSSISLWVRRLCCVHKTPKCSCKASTLSLSDHMVLCLFVLYLGKSSWKCLHPTSAPGLAFWLPHSPLYPIFHTTCSRLKTCTQHMRIQWQMKGRFPYCTAFIPAI